VSDPVIIIGGGISGLATAYFLASGGIRSILIEKSHCLGGLIQTNTIDGCVLEAGPDSYLAAKPAVTELARELPDLGDQIIGSNDAARRIFIVRSGKLVPLPGGMVMMVPAEWTPALRSPLFSITTKLRFITETVSRPRARREDVSVGDFVRDHFGSEVLEVVTEPLLAGVYGGDAETLSALSVLPRFAAYEQTYGSVIRGVRRERRSATAKGSLFQSFRSGMQSLTNALAGAAAEHMSVIRGEATRIERATRWRVRVNGAWMEASKVVLACPAHASARLLETTLPAAAGVLASIPYSSAILATFVYNRSELNRPLDGFGFLVPRDERRTIAAATWVSTKFPCRMPAHLAAVRVFILGDKATALLNAPQQTIAELARSDLAGFMGLNAPPRFCNVHFWPNSMPQYVVGHQQRRHRLAAALDDGEGLFLVGNAFDGVGIPDCVRLAKQTAKDIASGSPSHAAS
jgi:protoporphyrinogen/coproporphyrinogen III oxidase